MKRLQNYFLLLLSVGFAAGAIQLAHQGVFGMSRSVLEASSPQYYVTRADAAMPVTPSTGRPSAYRLPDMQRKYIIAHNKLGQSVGWALRPGNKSFHAFLWEGDKETDLGTLGGRASYAQNINDACEIVGNSETVNGSKHAFEWAAGHMTDLGTLGGDGSYANGINSRGQIVGDADTKDEINHAFLYENGSMRDLGTLGGVQSSAKDINNAGQVVGYSETGISVRHAFLWKNGTMSDLNKLLPRHSGWELFEAQQITDDGQITGDGENRREHLPFLLIPK